MWSQSARWKTWLITIPALENFRLNSVKMNSNTQTHTHTVQVPVAAQRSANLPRSGQFVQQELRIKLNLIKTCRGNFLLPPAATCYQNWVKFRLIAINMNQVARMFADLPRITLALISISNTFWVSRRGDNVLYIARISIFTPRGCIKCEKRNTNKTEMD